MPKGSKTAHRQVGIWIRVSTEDQARGDSLEHHEARARYHAQQKGWVVVALYALEGVSGKSVIRHPEALRMLSDVKSGKITALIFSKIARLARNTRELLEVWDVFETHRADLVSLDESIDTTTAAGKMLYTVMGTLAEWERGEIAARVKASIPIRARLGKSTGGKPPFGYRRVDGRLQVDETEAAVVRQMFELFAEHGRKGAVIRVLNQRGYRSRQGRQFEQRGTLRMLTDPVYKGLKRANYTQNRQHGDYYKHPSEWIYVEVPEVVPQDLWDRCNAILQRQKDQRKPATKPTAHLFAGFVVCHCGTKMYVRTRGRSYVCLDCGNRVGKDELESVFVEQLRGIVFSPEDVASQIEAADEDVQSKSQLLAAAEHEKSKVSAEMEKLYRLYSEDHISGRLFAERNAPLEERLRQLEDEVPKLSADVDFLRLQIRSSQQIVTEAQDIYSNWSSLDFQTKRSIVEATVDRIVIDGNDLTIELAHLHTPGSTRSQSSANTSLTPADTPRRSR